MEYFGSLETFQIVCLVLALTLALAFEFVNGFHDTANAVATVIYTNSLPPVVAVVWSGIWNLIGVLVSGGAVAFAIISLLPTELVTHVASAAGFAMVFSLLISAIVWNLGTWYLGLPASSSHTLIGSIMGVGLMESMMNSTGPLAGINWGKAREVGMSLLISPLVGFFCAALLLLLLKVLIRKPELYSAPAANQPPPLWIRGILCLTCTGVSFSHGGNDGQKGMGLIMLILVGIIPGMYALNLSTSADDLRKLAALSHKAAIVFTMPAAGAAPNSEAASKTLETYLRPSGAYSDAVGAAMAQKSTEINTAMDSHHSLSELSATERTSLRTTVELTAATIGKMDKGHLLPAAQAASLKDFKKALEGITRFVPLWVKIAVAFALGLGTMIGWKRIVVTVGEKIGKSHLTYGQGASAELVAMITIGLAGWLGLPVSTTHVLSSGVAGTMAANRSGLQAATLRNVLLAWVLTLPVCVFLGAMFFAAGLRLVSLLF
jgi:PiT family inorganic phosphate transporter